MAEEERSVIHFSAVCDCRAPFFHNVGRCLIDIIRVLRSCLVEGLVFLLADFPNLANQVLAVRSMEEIISHLFPVNVKRKNFIFPIRCLRVRKLFIGEVFRKLFGKVIVRKRCRIQRIRASLTAALPGFRNS